MEVGPLNYFLKVRHFKPHLHLLCSHRIAKNESQILVIATEEQQPAKKSSTVKKFCTLKTTAIK